MKQYLKKCKKSRATEEMQISLYYVFGNEYLGDTELPADASSPASSGTSVCCKHDESPEAGRPRLRSPDLEAVDNRRSEPFGMEIFTSTGVNFREATSSFEICGDSRQVMAREKPKLAAPATASRQRKSPVRAAKTPSAAELEEFFTEAEEYVQKRFAEKYNYDIVKDAPILGGRYQWVGTHI